MKSRPLPESILIFCLFLAAGFPLWHLTGNAGQPVAPPSRLDTASTANLSSLPVFVKIKFAHSPQQGTLALPDGTAFWTWQNGSLAEFETNLPLTDNHLPPLTFSVQWPEATPDTAVILTFEPEGLESLEKTFWAQDSLDIVIPLFH